MLIGRFKSRISFFDDNQTEHGSEVFNGLYQKFFSPLRNSLFRRSKTEKTSGIQGTLNLLTCSILLRAFRLLVAHGDWVAM